MKRLSGIVAAAGVAALAFGGVASASPFYLDVSAGGAAEAPGTAGTFGFGSFDANTFTSVLNQLQIYANTTSTQYDTNGGGFGVGDKFRDTGNAVVTAGLPSTGSDMEGLNIGVSELTIAWSGLTGTTTGLGIVGGDLVQTTVYDPGTVFNFYFDGNAPNAQFGTSVGSGDDSGFSDGTLVLQLTLTSGTGTNKFVPSTGAFFEGSSKIYGAVTFAKDNFWWFDNGDGTPGTPGDKDFYTDFLGLSVPIIISASVDQNTDEVVNVPGSAAGADPVLGPELFEVLSDHDGSLGFGVVPEPGTMLLLGSGLLGLAGYSRKRTKKS